jgi:hypothetical protein
MERLQKSIAPGAIVKVKTPLFRKLQFTVVSVNGSTAVVRHPKTGDRTFPLNKLVYMPACVQAEFKVGDEITFPMYWNGQTSMHEGVITQLNPHDIDGVAMVKFFPENSVGLGEVQLPIQQIALRSAESVPPEPCMDELILIELPPEPQPKTIDLPFDLGSIDEQIAAIRSQGPIPPAGIWVETCAVKNGFRQAYWRSRSPCFPSTRSGGNPEARLKRQYIGKQGSDAHKAALKAIARRNEIKKLEKSKNGR